MAEETKFCKDLSDVTVTFIDGEVRTYRISANSTIGGSLAREAGTNGVLSLWNKDKSWGIPTASIRDWEISSVPVEAPAAEQTNG